MSSTTNRVLAERLNVLTDKQLYARKFHELLFGVIRSLTSAIDARDAYTRGHSERVARVAVQIGRQMGLGSKEKSSLYLCGLLHDVGKIGVNDEVLRKPGPLTDGEYRHIMSHVEIGVSIVQEIRALRHLLPVIQHHHERYEGGGYPSGIAGESIPRLARILAVADGFDAMSHDRSYRPRRPATDVQQLLREQSGRQWDPEVVAAALDNWSDLITIQDRGLGTSLRFAVEKALPLQDSASVERVDSPIRDSSIAHVHRHAP